jgi:hypothetical protein
MADTKTLIETVFQAMTRHRPRLARFLETDPGEAVDLRELADQVVKGFPYPIGVELRRLFSSEHSRPDRGRLDQLFKTIERTLQFTAFVLLSQLLEEGPGPAAAPLFERLVKPGGLTMGDFAWFIQTTGDLFAKEAITPFMPELTEVLGKAFSAKLNFWTPERNEIGHYLINLDAAEIERRCLEYGERLAAILADLAFLIKYPLVSMVEIRVEKTKHSPARYSHRLKPLSSASTNLPEEALCETFSDSHAVLLLKSMQDPPTGFLNLSPLVIDTHAEELVSREQVQHVKKDLFLFSRRDRDGRLRYLGTTVTEQCDLRHLPCYGRLQTEFADYLRAAGQAPEAAP